MKRLSVSKRGKEETGECKFKKHVSYTAKKKIKKIYKKIPTLLNALTCKTHPFSIWRTVRSHQNVIVPIWRRDIIKEFYGHKKFPHIHTKSSKSQKKGDDKWKLS